MNHIYQNQNFGENWFTYPNLYKKFVKLCPEGGRIIEIGSWKGKSSAFLAVEIINSGKNIVLDCIDTWQGSPNEHIHQNDIFVKTDKLYELFLSNIEPIKNTINPIRLSSKEANNLYENNSIDIIFIDACHDYDCVIEDITLWLSKVKNGGILAGHDYGYSQWPGVKKAVDQLLGSQNIHTQEGCWIFYKK